MAVETAKAGKADLIVERGTGSQIPQREPEGQEREPRQSKGETEQRAKRGTIGRKLRG